MVSHFMMTDFQKIMDIIEQGIECENTSINEVNNKVKSWILQYYQTEAARNAECSSTITKPTLSVCAADEKFDLPKNVDPQLITYYHQATKRIMS